MVSRLVRPDFSQLPDLVPMPRAAALLGCHRDTLARYVERPGMACDRPSGIVAVPLAAGGPQKRQWAVERPDLELLWDAWYGVQVDL